MMPERSVGEPSDFIIWGSTGLLALLLGLGAAFVLWAALRHAAEPWLVEIAVGLLGIGMLLLGLATERPLTRLFFVLFAAMLIVGFSFGSPEFGRLLP
jgi:hypothetical protein